MKNNATIATDKKDREEATLIPELWAMKFFGYTLFEIKQCLDFCKAKNFEPEKTVFGN